MIKKKDNIKVSRPLFILVVLINLLIIYFSVVEYTGLKDGTTIVYKNLTPYEIKIIEKYVINDLKGDMLVGTRNLIFIKDEIEIRRLSFSKHTSGVFDPATRDVYVKIYPYYLNVSVSDYKDTLCHEVLHTYVGIQEWKHPFIRHLEGIREVCYNV